MFKTIFMKEMKDVLRDKRSITLLVLFPFLMMAGLTIFYDKILTMGNETEFTMAVDQTIDEELLQELEAAMPTMKIEKTEEVAKAVEDKEAQIGLAVDPDWRVLLNEQKPVPIQMIFDPGSQESTLASSMVEAAFANWQQAEVQLRLAGNNIDSGILEVFAVETKATSNEDHAAAILMLTILIPLLIPMAIANGSYPSATELFAGEKEKKTIEALLITPVKPIKILLAKWLTISLLGIFTGLLCIGVLSVLINFTTELKKGFSELANPGLFVIMSVGLIILFAVLFAEIEMILSMLANSVKEAGYYIAPVLSCLALPLMFMFFSGEGLSLPLYAVPVMNLFLFVRDIFSGQLTVAAYGIAVGSYLLLIGILFPVAYKLFTNHRLMLGK